MKRTSLFLIGLVFLVACLFSLGPSKAQTKSSGKGLSREQSTPLSAQTDQLKQVPQMVKNSKSAGAKFEQRELVQSAAARIDDDPQLREVLSRGATLNLNKPNIETILKEKLGFLTLPLPDGKGGTVVLELVQVNIFAPGFQVKTSQPTTEPVNADLGIHYRGIVKGDDHSLAVISIFKNEVMGFYSTEANGNSIIGRLGGNNSTDKHVVYAEKDLKVSSNFHCDTEDPKSLDPKSLLPSSLAMQAAPEAVAGACVRIYLEANYDLFLNKGSVDSTTSYLTGMFNQSAALFSNEGIPISISEIFVWTSQSPYDGADSKAVLEQFRAIRTSFNGDLAHLITLNRNFGGIAYRLNSLCNNSSRYAVSDIDPTYNSVPTYSWTIGVFTHETGHNMGSPHTHACVWNGNNTAIDGCATPEGNCSQPGLPSGGGTIMSYCHLTSAGINFSLGFGPQPHNVIVNQFNAATCLLNCGSGGGAPANNNFASAQIINGTSGNVTGSNVGATKETGEPGHAGNGGGASVWYQWQAPASGTVTITTAGSSFDTLLGVYTGTSVGSLATIASNDDDTGASVLTSRVSFNAVGGTTYRIAVDGFNGSTGSIVLNWNLELPAPPNNNFANAQVISGSSGSTTGTNVGATKEAGEPDHAGNTGGASIWYQWQAPTSGTAIVTTAGSSFDTILGVYAGSSVSGLTIIGSNDDEAYPNVLTSKVTFNAVGGTTYRIAVDGFSGAVGSITLNWNLTGSCPSITSFSPTSGVVGSSVTITGNNFTGVTDVRFNNNVSAAFTVNSNTQITATVPSGAATGPITIIKTGCNNVQTSTSFTVTASTVQITVQTNPSGRSFTVDGNSYTTPQTFSWTPGTSHSISTTSTQGGGVGTQYVWNSWSDGGAISHNVAPASSTTYTANFNTQYFLTMNAGSGGSVTPASNWYASGQSVTITALPNSGFNFSGWAGIGNGSFTGANNPSTVTMNGPVTETASFTVIPLRLDSVSPAAGRASGGQQIRLAGSFANLSTVRVGGVAASWSYTNGISEIAVTTPAHAVGAVNIELVPTTGNTLSKSNAFAYLPTTFTDNTLVAGVTTAKTSHIIELRQAVDALRAVAGLQPASWTEIGLVPFVTIIKAVHIQELRSNLNDVMTRLGYPTQAYTDPSLTALYVIKRVYIEELRQRIRTIAG